MKALGRVWVAMLCLCWSSCNRTEAPRYHLRYTVGPAWQSGAIWFYPAERSSYAATGLAVVDGPETRLGRETADGERYDPSLLTGSHQTLQLPAVLRVRNLENGREILVRLNDRGPGSPGRLLSVSPRAAALLQMDSQSATRVAVSLEQSRSESLLAGLDGAPGPDIAAAPVAPVQEEDLLPGHAVAPADHQAPGDAIHAPQGLSGTGLPELVTQTWPDPGRLWIEAGQFSALVYASAMADRLSGRVRKHGIGRNAVFQVWLGPFDRVPDADAALDRVLSAGVTGAQIVVE